MVQSIQFMAFCIFSTTYCLKVNTICHCLDEKMAFLCAIKFTGSCFDSVETVD